MSGKKSEVRLKPESDKGGKTDNPATTEVGGVLGGGVGRRERTHVSRVKEKEDTRELPLWGGKK